MTYRWIATLSVILAANPVIADDDSSAEFPDAVLNDSQWQALPLGVRTAVADHSGKVWLHDGRGRAKPELEDLQAHLAEQFTKDIPLIRNAEAQLFEPDGRVWFVAHHLKLILGYDGKTWITKTNGEEDWFDGRCLTRGGLAGGQTHRFAGGTAWFRGRHGVFSFSGGKWAYQQIIEPNGLRGREVRLSVEPQGRLVVAWSPGRQVVSLFHNNQWLRHHMASRPPESGQLTLAVESPRSVLFIDDERHVRRISIGDDGQTTESPAGESVPLGNAVVSDARDLLTDDAGHVYVIAGKIDFPTGFQPSIVYDETVDDLAQPDRTEGVATEGRADGGAKPRFSGSGEFHGGVVIVGAADEVQVLYGNRMVTEAFGWRLITPAIAAQPGHRVWLPNRLGYGRPLLVDPRPAEIVFKLPFAQNRTLHAVDAQGRLYVSTNNRGSYSEPIRVWTPNGKSNRPLEFSTHRIGRGPVVVSGDGTVWTTDRKDRLISYIEGGWYTFTRNRFPGTPERDSRHSTTLIAGPDGLVLAVEGDRAAVLDRTRTIASGDVFQVLEEHTDRIRRDFGPDQTTPQDGMGFQLAPTSDGRIWCVHNGVLRVLDDGFWYDAVDALKSAGSRHGRVSVLAPIGDSGRVFVSDLKLRHDGGRSFFGEFRDGEFQFIDAPYVRKSHDGASRYTVRDSDGGLWIGSTQGRANGPSDRYTGQEAVRAIATKIDQSFVNSGHAVLAEASGNVWLAGIRGQTKEHVNIWHDGEIIQKLKIPGGLRGALFSHESGSVYGATGIGLQQLVTDNADGKRFRLGNLYPLPDVGHSAHLVALSQQGYAVMTSYGNAGRQLHLVHRPEK